MNGNITQLAKIGGIASIALALVWALVTVVTTTNATTGNHFQEQAKELRVQTAVMSDLVVELKRGNDITEEILDQNKEIISRQNEIQGEILFYLRN